MNGDYQMWVGGRKPPEEPCGRYHPSVIQPWIEVLAHECSNFHELTARAVLSQYCRHTIERYRRNPRDCFNGGVELVPRVDPDEIFIRTQGTSVLIKVPHTQGPW